jgi:hypothetical protein
MRHRSAEDVDRLERILIETHRAGPTRPLDEEWAQGVMRDVRREAREMPEKQMAWVERCVWRTAAAATAVAVLLVGSLFLYTGAETGELAALLPEEWEAGSAILE